MELVSYDFALEYNPQNNANPKLMLLREKKNNNIEIASHSFLFDIQEHFWVTLISIAIELRSIYQNNSQNECFIHINSG